MGKSALLFLFLLLLGVTLATPASLNSNGLEQLKTPIRSREDLPEIHMSTPEMIKYHGYPVEEHEVTTDDGYILTMHRIPHGISNRSNRKEKKVMFLQHGLLCSSADWVVMGPGKGFAYILADAGYDVWMGNARGNTYSKKHTSLSTNDAKFWDFSWNEMGEKDLPVVIDYVLAHTGKDKVFYAGHSMGTTMFYVMCALRPEYNNKIIAHFSLAPVAFVSREKSPLRLLAPFINEIDWIAKMLGANEVMPHSDLLSMIGATFCKDTAITQSICSNFLFLLCGYDSQQLNETMIPVITGHDPAGSSTKTIVHYAQEINSGKFRQYDYGLLGNRERYGRNDPPEYDLSLISAPIYLHYAENDLMSNVEDVEKLYEILPNSRGKFDVPFKKFNHLDFLWAIDVKNLLYNKILSLMARL